jgi:acetyl-CoA carboxylase biotin carboxyl carrier protein
MSASIDNGLPGTLPDVAELVAVLADRALAMSAQATRAPSSVRVAVGEVQVEVAWPVNQPDQLPLPAPVRVAAPALVAAAPEPVVANDPNSFPLCAATVGVFYRSAEPGAAPFVGEGDTVRPGQQVGIVEAMKLMIPVEADRAGRIVELLVADAEAVEHGQPLMLLAGVDR